MSERLSTKLVELVFMARVAEQAERSEDMVKYISEAVKMRDKDLSNEERTLLSIGFKMLVGQRRTAIRTIQAIAPNPKYLHFAGGLTAYKKSLEEEMFAACKQLIEIVRDHALPRSGTPESKAFFLKMIADYYRYISEAAEGDLLQEAKTQAEKYYAQTDEVVNELSPWNPIRLGLALNFSVFYYEVMDDAKRACEIAEAAYELTSNLKAREGEHDLNAATMKDAMQIRDLIKENLQVWSRTEEEQKEES